MKTKDLPRRDVMIEECGQLGSRDDIALSHATSVAWMAYPYFLAVFVVYPNETELSLVVRQNIDLSFRHMRVTTRKQARIAITERVTSARLRCQPYPSAVLMYESDW